MRRPIAKSVEFSKHFGQFLVSFYADGAPIVDVFFDDAKAGEGSSNQHNCFFYLGSGIVMVEDISLYDLFCEFRKQDEAAQVAADSSSQCSKCGCDLIHPDGPLCMPCDISGGAA